MVSPDLYSIGAQLRVFITVSAYVPISVGSATLYFVSKMSLLQILHHSFYNKHVPLCLFLSISHTTIFHVHIQYSHTHTHTHIHCKHTFTVDTHSLYTHCTYTHAGIHTHYSHTHTQTHKHTKKHTHTHTWSKLLMLLFIFYPDDLKNAVSTLHLSYSERT